MKKMTLVALTAAVILLAACSQERADENAAESIEENADNTDVLPVTETTIANPLVIEIEPGLTMRILQEGNGASAAVGQVVTVHYTGWLHDAAADNARGKKFDSSVDSGKYFEFSLGAGQVIRGWDRGVAGMKIGETRELTIAPEWAYGERAIGDLIPSGSTLVFEIALAGLSGAEPGSD